MLIQSLLLDVCGSNVFRDKVKLKKTIKNQNLENQKTEMQLLHKQMSSANIIVFLLRRSSTVTKMPNKPTLPKRMNSNNNILVH